MNKVLASVVAACFLGAPAQFLAMSNYDDPRVVLSYMDRSLAGARDILRLNTSVEGDTHLVFEIKTRAPEQPPEAGDYVLLQLSQGRAVQLLVPIDPALGDAVLDYQRDLAPGGEAPGLAGSVLKPGSGRGVFTARRVPRGIEFLVPLAWVDFGEKISFDAFTVKGQPTPTTFQVEAVYDQAGKGQKTRPRHSPITLLNKLCATRK